MKCQVFLGLLCALVFFGCENKENSLLNSQPEDAYRVKMDVRLKATHQMRKFLDRLDGATAPLDGALEDISRIVSGDFKIEADSRAIAERIVLPKLKKLLKEARKDLVHVDENGSFYSTAEIEWPVERTSQATNRSCKQSLLRIQGDWSEDQSSQVSVVIDDCMSESPIQIVTASLTEEGKFSATVFYGNLRMLAGDKVAADFEGCRIEAEKSYQTITCDPFTFAVDQFDVEVQKFQWSRYQGNVSGELTSVFSMPKQRPVEVSATLSEGKPRIVLKKVRD